LSEDPLDLLTDAAIAIGEDKELKQRFLQVLSVGTYTQQIRVAKLQEAIASLNPPETVTKVLRLLQNDKLAQVFYAQLKNH
jgi:hypothetical protein